jgi:1,4-alpha-glucan branching enzyme
MAYKEPLAEQGIVRVTFTLPPEVEGRVIHLVGEFTGWEGTPMERQGDGSWKTVVDLAPGRSYQYRFQIDGVRWENDWDADNYVANPFGQDNSVVETPSLGRRPRKQAPTKQANAKQAATRKATAKKAPAKKAATKKTAAKAASSKQATSKKAATRKAKARTGATKRPGGTQGD